VVERAPATGAFRPPYTGTAIPESWNTRNLQTSLLGSLEAVTGTPTLQSLLAKMENPLWGDQHPGWIATGAFAPGNSPTYGRDISSLHGEAALALHLDFPLAEKMPLLIALVQRGIDTWGIAVEEGEENWTPNGGHASGRKWPILFAQLMLGMDLTLIGWEDALFGEDAQTWIVDESDIGRNGYTAEWVGRPEWGIRHATSPQHDNPSIVAPYRTCCTANAWGGFVMAARIMRAMEAWGHPALFEYYDRYVREIFPATGLSDWQLDWSDSRWVSRTYVRHRSGL
jgi:hypothetical protein